MRWPPRGSGLQSKPGVPWTGWQWQDMEDLGAPNEICEWCGKRSVRFVNVMRHPSWPTLVRVDSKCAERMGDTDASKRVLEFRRELTRQRRLPADDATANGEREPFSAFKDDLRTAWARSRDDVWLQVLVFLLVIALLLVFFPPWS
jgi:hypothetical protein